MKKSLFLPFAMLIAVTAWYTTKAQTIQTPEAQYKMMFVNPDGSLAPLDKSMMSQEAKGRSVKFVADGETSSVTHSGKKADKYIVKLMPGMDPENAVELYQFDEVKKGKRKCTTATVSLTGGSTSATTSIKLEYKKQADGVYVYNTTEDLQPGDYFFLVMKGMSTSISTADQMSGHTICAYCFKVQ